MTLQSWEHNETGDQISITTHKSLVHSWTAGHLSPWNTSKANWSPRTGGLWGEQAGREGKKKVGKRLVCRANGSCVCCGILTFKQNSLHRCTFFFDMVCVSTWKYLKSNVADCMLIPTLQYIIITLFFFNLMNVLNVLFLNQITHTIIFLSLYPLNFSSSGQHPSLFLLFLFTTHIPIISKMPGIRNFIFFPLSSDYLWNII